MQLTYKIQPQYRFYHEAKYGDINILMYKNGWNLKCIVEMTGKMTMFDVIKFENSYN